MVVIAGVSASHMLVSQISAMSARELVQVGVEERRQVDAARFLLALEQHRDRERQLAGHRLPGAAGLDEGHQLALVVGGAAADQHLRAVRAGDDLRVERIVLPELERVDRLHVVVAVEQHRRAVARRAGGRPPSDGRRCRAPRRRSRSRAGRRRATRRRRGSRRHRPGRSRSTSAAASRTAARARRRGRRRWWSSTLSRSDMRFPQGLSLVRPARAAGRAGTRRPGAAVQSTSSTTV